MLWKKESGRPDALYIDVITPSTQHWDTIIHAMLQMLEKKPHPEKSDAIALKKRNEGNKQFRDTIPLNAMVLYNDSLRYAQPGSEHISLAYANRAACFLKMKKYDECLIDIGNAIAAGYPAQLRPKLDERKARCLKEMQEDPEYPREKWSIEPNEKFPCLSKMAKIQRDKNGSYSVVAAADIDVGQPLVIDDPFFLHVRREFGLHCNICSKEVSNLVPCEKCAAAMFCPECKGHFLHEYECGLNFAEDRGFNNDVMSLVRSILLVLNLFPTADELMAFVEDLLKKPNELPDSLLDDRSKYHAFFNCPMKENSESLDRMRLLIYPTYKTILRIPRFNEMFATTKHRRFLMHLIGHHKQIPQNVAGVSTDVVGHDSLGPPVRFTPAMQSYVKHSCYPNVEFVINGGMYHWYSVKPIKKGEQLCIFNVQVRYADINERTKYLLDDFSMMCDCSRCHGKTASLAERQQLLADPTFRYIHANVKSLRPLILNSMEIQRLKEACVTVLQKFGRMDWCDEIGYVLLSFHTLYPLAHQMNSISQ